MTTFSNILCRRCICNFLIRRRFSNSPKISRITFLTNISLKNAASLRLRATTNVGSFVKFYSVNVPQPPPRREDVDENYEEEEKKSRKNFVMYLAGTAVLFLGLSFAAVPLYRMLCQATGLGGTVRKGRHVDADKIDTMKVNKKRLLKIRFEASKDARMIWDFKPLQTDIWVHPGETALAFYSAKNPTHVPIVGVSTYNVIPYDAGKYFAKIQCFCFEEQMLNPGEELDMPVFFYVDPDFCDDPAMEFVDQIVLSYTFFESSQSNQILKPFKDQLSYFTNVVKPADENKL